MTAQTSAYPDYNAYEDVAKKEYQAAIKAQEQAESDFETAKQKLLALSNNPEAFLAYFFGAFLPNAQNMVESDVGVQSARQDVATAIGKTIDELQKLTNQATKTGSDDVAEFVQALNHLKSDLNDPNSWVSKCFSSDGTGAGDSIKTYIDDLTGDISKYFTYGTGKLTDFQDMNSKISQPNDPDSATEAKKGLTDGFNELSQTMAGVNSAVKIEISEDMSIDKDYQSSESAGLAAMNTLIKNAVSNQKA